MKNKNVEIERKFLVKEIPSKLSNYKYSLIKQGYISIDPVIRLRQLDNKYILTLKGTGQIKRTEFEYELNENQFLNLWEKVENKKIIKKRYYIPIGSGLIAELDIYEDEFNGFVNVEVEFNSENEAVVFVPPKWFGEEISLDKRYTNASMSIYGIPSKN